MSNDSLVFVRAVLSGLLVMLIMSITWAHMSYDLLRAYSEQLFYRVNAPWLEHPQQGMHSDPLLLGTLFLGAVFVSVPATLVTLRLSSRKGRRAVGTVVSIGMLPTGIGSLLAFLGKDSLAQGLMLGLYLLLSFLAAFMTVRLVERKQKSYGATPKI